MLVVMLVMQEPISLWSQVKWILLAEKSKTNKTKHLLTGYVFGINQKHFLHVEPQVHPRKWTSKVILQKFFEREP